ncbi:sigma-70 family RNA polymerase sigma factor [Leucobacter massiliensis]|uniref:sigma-70 family RNA polymerase sigma factor n=1 Tax=Leucobacter massiliensis TaxID=1686285 RepID=UPI0015E4455B|nr:sigma-70 family RNA polymerase sigma factor [Leucobacter massiliensis]
MPDSLPSSDEQLLAAWRAGDDAGVAELWERHHGAALHAARRIAPRLDPEDVASEAFLKIFETVRRGAGPHGAFRPYLYRVIRSIAYDRAHPAEEASDLLDLFPADMSGAPWEDAAFDESAAATAYASLTPRWQAVLWYSEVEGLPPREIAVLLGISANGVSALTIRAREALRSAWAEAHVLRSPVRAECRAALQELQRYTRGKLPARRSRAIAAHLAHCDACSRAAGELDTLNRRLALVLITVLLGVGGPAVAVLDPSASSAAQAHAPRTKRFAVDVPGRAQDVLAAASIAAVAAAGLAGAAALLSPVGAVSPVIASGFHHEPATEAASAGRADDRAESRRADHSSPNGHLGASGPRDEDGDDGDDAHTTPASARGPVGEPDGHGSADHRAADGSSGNSAASGGPAPASSSASGDGSPGGTAQNGGESAGDAQGGVSADGDSASDGSGNGAGDDGGADSDADALGGADSTGPDTGADGGGSPDEGSETADGSDPSLNVGFACYVDDAGQGFRLIGTASHAGAIKARITPPGSSTPVELIEYPTITDAQGVSYEDVFTGTDPEPDPWWWTPELTPLSKWPGLEDHEVAEVLIEMRLLGADGRYSPWRVVTPAAVCE